MFNAATIIKLTKGFLGGNRRLISPNKRQIDEFC